MKELKLIHGVIASYEDGVLQSIYLPGDPEWDGLMEALKFGNDA